MCYTIETNMVIRKVKIFMYIIAGLGNPSSKYEHTRHNVGFDAIDYIADKHGIKVDILKHKALCGVGIINGQKVILVKPQTFMNLSGESLASIVNFYKINPEDELIVIYDDISLDVGRLRLRGKGSAGGHNGIKSIISHLGTEKFKRIKTGVGDKPANWDLADYVLGHFSPADMKIMNETFGNVNDAVECIISEGMDRAMCKFN